MRRVRGNIRGWLGELLQFDVFSRFLAIVMMGLAVGSVTSYLASDNKIREEIGATIGKVERNSTEIRFNALESQVAELRQAIANAGQKPLQDAVLQEKLLQLDRLNRDLQELKAVIVEDPTKALSLPLMRKDIADLTKRQDMIATSVEVQISRIYGFSQWFLALMVTLVIGMLTMGFYRARKESQPKADTGGHS